MNIKVISHVTQIGTVKANKMEPNEIESNVKIDSLANVQIQRLHPVMEALILHVKEQGESVGGVVETIVLNAPAGLGEPVFDKLDSDIAGVLMGIGSVKGVEIGVGFKVAELKGSQQMNDEFYKDKKIVKTRTNHAGGILGGISTGMSIIARMAVKPTPSISKMQKTIDIDSMEDAEIIITGRHDPCICPRITTVSRSFSFHCHCG